MEPDGTSLRISTLQLLKQLIFVIDSSQHEEEIEAYSLAMKNTHVKCSRRSKMHLAAFKLVLLISELQLFRF